MNTITRINEMMKRAALFKKAIKVNDYLRGNFDEVNVYINKEKKTVTLVSQFDETLKCQVKCGKEDKFNEITGVELVLFEFITSYSYGKVAKAIEAFAPSSKKEDPTMNFIKTFLKDFNFVKESELKDLLNVEKYNEKGIKKLELCFEA